MNDQENTNVLQQNYILWKWEISLNDQDQLKYRYVSGEMKLGRKDTAKQTDHRSAGPLGLENAFASPPLIPREPVGLRW